ncbi:glycoside hydrolase family 13 protein [bacterium]|nr:MAG: glycoside hydrolase family 13 protein [bacterium]
MLLGSVACIFGASLSTMTLPSRFDERAKDWRNGAVVYQVFVDRFAEPTNPSAKQRLYPTPLREWHQTPKATAFDPVLKTYPHVREFWGGDLAGLRSKLDYIKDLGADVVYPLPIFKSPSNHKYDTEDYFAVDPQYGTEADLKGLIADLHRRGMRLMLDGVFNHIGEASKVFRDPAKKDWFFFGSEYPEGYRGWAGVSSLPALRLENPAVRDYLWNGRDSVLRHYLRMGIDGWRLDVAFELGPLFLKEITEAAHRTKPGSAVVGEISGYPAGWEEAVDGTFNFTPVALTKAIGSGMMTGGQAGRMLAHMVDDAGIDSLLKSWLLVENHDTPRLASDMGDESLRQIAMTLQLTLPGSPCLYYGEEIGMEGKGDPENRAPMQWGHVDLSNFFYRRTKELLRLRRDQRSLRVGDLTVLDTNKLLGYARTTDRLRETTIVLINPTVERVRETVATRVGRLMSWGELRDVSTLRRLRSINGFMEVDMSPRSVLILTPVDEKNGGYSPYDRIP